MGLGLEDRTACEFNQVRWVDYQRWKIEDPQFAIDIDQSYSLATSRLVDRAYFAGMAGDAKLLERSLEIRDKERFGPKGSGGGASKSLDDMTVGELADLVMTLKRQAEADANKTINGDFTEVPVDDAAK